MRQWRGWRHTIIKMPVDVYQKDITQKNNMQPYHTPLGDCVSNCRREGCPEPQESHNTYLMPTDAQISYLLQLLGYFPWNNNEELISQIREKVDKITVSSCIEWIKNGDEGSAVKQLNYLGVNVCQN